jgi:DNA-binding NarL/FixJ family response regulator
MDHSVNSAAAAPARVHDRRKILIVDDHAEVLRVLRTSLEHHGYIVCGEAENGIDAIARAVATRPDLVILDVAMPGLNGIEVASALQRLLPDVPIILHTIYGDHVGKSFAGAFGIRAIVAKTDGVNKLIECVHSVLKGVPESDQP